MYKIGLVAPYWADVTKEELIDIAQLAEGLGYDSIWVPEMWGRDAFSILALLALNTKKIKLGTGIVPVYSRTPAVIAQTIATLDEFSDGRMMLGLGSSGAAVIESWHGVKFDKPLQRTREYVDIIKMILNHDRVKYSGELFKLRSFQLQFKPLRGDIPVYIAAMGPKNVRLVGEVADGWIPFLTPIEEIETLKGGIKAGADSAGRSSEDIKICPYVVAAVSRDGKTARNQASEHIAHYVGGMGEYYYSAMKRFGFSEEAEHIKYSFENGNRSEAAGSVSERMLDSLSISGTPESAEKLLRNYINADIESPVLIFPPKSSRELVLDTIKALAPLKPDR